ncbi:hypothetical protein PACTADRAFT_49345 [Pachysolen tannophilus NRRL Y-2460]|uniref:30S ribosomal protein S12 n=1 Tax=Pachysolen tannophilus NRRL Y-2460 TaxID=669874 RepID=A0A1E4TVY6_PACTA|nr:hypothetical protein PACTADRAFT_49345 [Pachysolen tannophilus NRRL Y-2460]
MLKFVFRSLTKQSSIPMIGAKYGSSMMSSNNLIFTSFTKKIINNFKSQEFNFPISQKRFATLNQIKRGGGRIKRPARQPESPDLENCPIKKGVVVRVMILKPKKPNSAQRKAARVRLSNGKVVSAYIPGEGHNAQEHSVVYVRGGRVQDLPGVKYHLIRGAMDLSGVANKITARSKYGVKKPQKTS